MDNTILFPPQTSTNPHAVKHIQNNLGRGEASVQMCAGLVVPEHNDYVPA